VKRPTTLHNFVGRKPNRRRGMSLPEVMIGLTISSMVLTGVAISWITASKVVEENDQFFRATQAARVSVNQIMTEARRCLAGVVDVPALELTLYNGEKRNYELDTTDRCLKMTTYDPITGAPSTYVMARNVADASFVTDGTTVTLTINVQVGKNQMLVSGSAVPRRMITYK
jgi:prepilin-type N-terminal cleavage/methylation domain-containing protein